MLQTSVVQWDGIAPWGEIRLAGDATAVCGVKVHVRPESPERSEYSAVLGACAQQLRDYFSGTRREFTVPVQLMGTPFQRIVWSAVGAIPYGHTCTYAELARRCARPQAVRAVAAALARNPVLILVPCHRVLGQGGALRGYAGGLAMKAALLALEQRGSLT
jgi:methylated-DNA-[protein]-cysteine S-methyltransferase